MGRQIRRVPLDFDWPLDTVWAGFLMPDRFDEDACPDCTSGYSPHAQHLYDLWYGKLPFDPASTGSTPLSADTPAVRAFAERNVLRDETRVDLGDAQMANLVRAWFTTARG